MASDTAGWGTNALFLRLHADFDYCFGDHSLAAHQQAAAQRGMSAQVLQLPGLALDVDTPADLFTLDERIWQRQPA
jgi:2-phospho-L-lactate guanylyltransferase